MCLLTVYIHRSANTSICNCVYIKLHMNSCRCLHAYSVSRRILLVSSPCLSITCLADGEKPGPHPLLKCPIPVCARWFQDVYMGPWVWAEFPDRRITFLSSSKPSPEGSAPLVKTPTPSPQPSRPMQEGPVHLLVLISPCLFTAALTKPVPPQGLCPCSSLACSALLPALHLTW